MTMIFSVASIVLIILAFCGFKLWKASREIEQLLKVNSGLQGQVNQQKADIQRKNMELINAKVKRKNDETVKRASGNSIDDQLHAKGYFRDDSNWLSGVQPDLSKPCGHDGNETPSACSQPDL